MMTGSQTQTNFQLQGIFIIDLSVDVDTHTALIV